ncbi:unnamed protein product, partial [Ectocarpus sp. 13 AM-2016]
NTEYDRLINAFTRSEQAQVYRDMKPNLTGEQKKIFDTVTVSALQDRGGVYMIDAPPGTGKSYTICAISSNLRAQEKLVLCTASTGWHSYSLTSRWPYRSFYLQTAVWRRFCRG